MANLYEELKERLKLDKNDLDEEYIQQPTLFYSAARESGLAAAAREKAHENVKIVSARTDEKLRREMNKHGEKVTETAIRAKLLTHADVLAAQEAENDAIKLAAKWQAMHDAYKERSHALRGLTSLFQANYWVSESGGKFGREAKDRQADAGREAANKLRKERRG